VEDEDGETMKGKSQVESEEEDWIMYEEGGLLEGQLFV